MNILAGVKQFIHADIRLAGYGIDEVMGKLIDNIYLKPLKKSKNDEKYEEFAKLKKHKWDKWVQKSAQKFERNFNKRIPAEDFVGEFAVFMLSNEMKNILKKVDPKKKDMDDVLRLFNKVLSTQMLAFGQGKTKNKELSIDEERGEGTSLTEKITDKTNPKELDIDEKDVVKFIKKEIPKFLDKHKEKRNIGGPTLVDLYNILLKTVKKGGDYTKALQESYKKWVDEGMDKGTLQGKWVALKKLLFEFFKKEERSTGIPPNLFKKMLKMSSRVYAIAYIRGLSKWMLACGDCDCKTSEEEDGDAVV